MNTPFARILERVVRSTPGAVGSAFAAGDGETVDSVSGWDRHEWDVLTAHYGVLFKHVRAALRLRHFGMAQHMLISHESCDILVYDVYDDYYAVLVLRRPGCVAAGMKYLERAVGELRQEMM